MGWLAALTMDTGLEVAVFRRFAAIWAAHTDAKAILVDIPIGLPGKARPARKADVLARKMLGRHHSCGFSPGVRDILKYTDYRAASDHDRTLTGKKISLQYWHIVEKAKEVDIFIRSVPTALYVAKESRPEICFEKVAIT